MGSALTEVGGCGRMCGFDFDLDWYYFPRYGRFFILWCPLDCSCIQCRGVALLKEKEMKGAKRTRVTRYKVISAN